MADFAGLTVSNFLTNDDFSMSVGTMRALSEAGEAGDTITALAAPLLVDNYASGGFAAPTPPEDNFAGRLDTDMTPGLDWFEHVHIIPRTQIDFGNIVGTVERRYELFNAYRRTPVTLTGVVNNATPGVETPYAVPPQILPALTSALDPASTTNLTAVADGLGILVQNLVRALPQGLPAFDTTIEFTFSPGGTLILEVKGNRIALVAMSVPPEAGMQESLAFLTDIIEAVDGSEQRISLRKRPRQEITATYMLEGTDRARMHSMLMGWQSQVFAVPLWQESVILTANAAVSAVSVTVNSTTDVDFRVGGLAVIFETPFKYDVVQVTSVTSTTVGFSGSPLLNSYTARDPAVFVMPVRTCEIVGAPTSSRPPANLETFNITFRVTDNDTGAPAGSLSGWNTHDGKILLDDCNVVDGSVGASFDQRITVIDNQTGLVHQNSRWEQNRRVHQKTFGCHTRAEILTLKKLLWSLDGRRISFWIPTFAEELVPVANLSSGSFTLDITHIGYTRFVDSREPKKTFRITFTDGTTLVREVQSSAEVSTSVERLTLDLSWPSTKTPAQVERIEWYEKVRFDTDNFTFDFLRAGNARVSAPVKVVLE